jgi:iron complex transport system permease protein
MARLSSLATWVACCVGLTLVLSLGGLLVGTSNLQTSFNWITSGDAQFSVVLYDIRLPRTLGAWFAGAILGLAGAIAQGVFRNPLAEPYLLGTASGAALGVTFSLIAVDASIGSLAWTGKFGVTAAASVGAGVATAFTLALSRGVVQTSRLLLSGIVVGFLLSAVTSLLLLTRPETWRTMQVFLLGSTGYLGWSSTLLLVVIFVACLVPAVLLSRGLDALTLGDDTAASLGLSLPALRLSLLAVMSVATAAVVGQVGLIGFIGLVAPHLVREALTVNHRQLLLAAPLCGGALLQAADLLSRWVVRPAELPVGAITACIGGTYLVFLLWRRSRDG